MLVLALLTDPVFWVALFFSFTVTSGQFVFSRKQTIPRYFLHATLILWLVFDIAFNLMYINNEDFIEGYYSQPIVLEKQSTWVDKNGWSYN